jgi:hypothetical protein
MCGEAAAERVDRLEAEMIGHRDECARAALAQLRSDAERRRSTRAPARAPIAARRPARDAISAAAASVNVIATTRSRICSAIARAQPDRAVPPRLGRPETPGDDAREARSSAGSAPASSTAARRARLRRVPRGGVAAARAVSRPLTAPPPRARARSSTPPRRVRRERGRVTPRVRAIRGPGGALGLAPWQAVATSHQRRASGCSSLAGSTSRGGSYCVARRELMRTVSTRR